MKILITGSAGFIGYHLAATLLKHGHDVVGIDNLNEYYDVDLKYGRLLETGISKEEIQYATPVSSKNHPNYKFVKLDLSDLESLHYLFKKENFEFVCNLAAQAGVRYSLINPHIYMQSNFQGFLNILECCRIYEIKHFVYASSSSVYGLNERMPFSVHQNVDHPISLYAASKKSNELLAHTYSYLFNLPTTGLRFFTVYGPWGRPDMALFLFTKAIIEGKPIQIFNGGNMKRDFTYVDDIIEGVVKILDRPSLANSNWNALDPDPATSSAPYRVYNIGRGSAVNLMDFIYEIEKNLGKKALKDFLPLQDGDVIETWADTKDLEDLLMFKPSVTVEEGVKRFVKWYKNFYTSKVAL